MTLRSVLLVLAAFCTHTGVMAQDTVTYGLAGNIDVLDPNVTTFVRTARVTVHVAEPLIWQPAPGEFVAGLATEWSSNENATAYTLELREGVTFQDGTPFNAEAVRFTFDRIADPETQSQVALNLLGPYEATEVVDDHTVVIRFSEPFAPFLDSLSYPYLAPVSPTAFRGAAPGAWGDTELVGTGPYALESYTPDSEVVLTRNHEYWGGPSFGRDPSLPDAERLVFKVIPEPATRTAALETGEVDMIEDVSEIDFSFLESSDDFTTVSVPLSGSGRSLMMNVQNPPMDELSVRRAIQLASDKEGMVLAIWNGFGTPSCGPLTRGIFGFDPATCDTYPYDPEEAKRVLEEAGWVDGDGDGIRERDGQELVLDHYYQADVPLNQQMADYMKADLAAVGIDVELHGVSRSGYFDAVRAGEHHTQNWLHTATDPDVVRVLFHSSNAGGGTNRNNYVDEEMDALIDEAAASPDPEVRTDIYSQIQQKVKDEAIMVFYSDTVTLYAHQSGIQPTLYLAGLFPLFY